MEKLISKEIASNCIKCQRCMNECLILSDIGECPKDIFSSYLSSHTIDPMIPYSCNLCNRCTMVCPNKLPIPQAFMAMREAIVKENKGRSPLKGHKSVEMHQKLSFGFLKIFTTRRK